MSPKSYQLLEHTADIYIRVKAKDLKSLFVNSAEAMFDISTSAKKPISKEKITFPISQTAVNKEELFINWLNELLSLSAVKKTIFTDFKIKKFSENTIEADVSAISAENFEIKTEIKAATYHDLVLKSDSKVWIAEVIFDV